VFDIVRKEFEIDHKIISHSVSPTGVTKQHFNAAFDGYMMHYKGSGKDSREKLIAKVMRRKGKQ
jgi:hypothetical protein